MTETLRFGATTCTIGPDWVVTRLPSGAEVHAHPDGTPEQLRTAHDLGYGGDAAAMTRDHDVLHVALAHWLGLHASLAMQAASGEPVSQMLVDYEEGAVLAVQRLCRATGRWPWAKTS